MNANPEGLNGHIAGAKVGTVRRPCIRPGPLAADGSNRYIDLSTLSMALGATLNGLVYFPNSSITVGIRRHPNSK